MAYSAILIQPLCYQLVYNVALEAGKMLIGKNHATPEETAAVIDQIVIGCCEHIDVELRQVKILEKLKALIGLIKIEALTDGNGSSPGTVLTLPFFIGLVVGAANFRKVIHILGAELHLSKTGGTVVIKRDMQGTITDVF